MNNKNKKHILFVITRSDDIGGAHIHVRDLALWLNKKNYRVTILVGGKGYYIDHLRSFKLKVVTCSSLSREISLLNDLITIFKLNYLINKIKPDLISIHSAKSGILVRFLRFFKVIPKCIFTAHGWSFSTSNKLQKTIYKFLETLFSPIPEKIITVCRNDLNIAESYKIAKPNKMICIHNGMPNIYDYKENKINRNKPIKLIMTARFEPQKDHKLLIESLSKLKITNWKLKLLGKGKLEKEIYDMCEHFGIIDKVEFLGWTSDVSYYLKESDIYILTSNWEGFPRSILEALREGLPIIATDVGGVSESVKNNINGYLVPRSNSIKLIESLRTLISNPLLIEEFGRNSREIYLNNFQFSTMAIKTEDIYQRILNKSYINHKK